MRIAVIGTGYVGTVAGACFAEAGHSVICVDQDARKIAALSSGRPVIHEPGLEPLLRRNLRRGRIRFTTSLREAVDSSEILFMTVGTPPKPDGEADLSFLQAASEEIGRAMRAPKIIVNKSTVPVGTHRKVAAWIRRGTHLPFDIVSNPEFLREGAAISDFLEPERVIIGTPENRVFSKMRALYQPFIRDPARVLWMDPVSAELTKYACNAMLATRISFMNELARLCERSGGDIECIRKGMGLDSRIGDRFLNAGIGYGGSCFPKDIRALLSTASDHDLRLRIIEAVEEINQTQKKHLIRAVSRRFGTRLQGRSFAVWGLAFKPDTDDIREAPALSLIRELLSAGAAVRAYDPVAIPNARAELGDQIVYALDPYSALDRADGLILATEWQELLRPDFARMKRAMRQACIFDGRNALDPKLARDAGFEYIAVGRGSLAPANDLLPLARDSATEKSVAIEPKALTA